MLTTKERSRYDRHLIIPEFTEEDQVKLKNAKILVIGAGGLGSPVLLYLSAAGIGQIGLVEQDTVSESNLQRQVLYSSDQVGQSKGQIALSRIGALNPNCNTVLHECWWTKENAEEIAQAYDILIDCTDNFESRPLSDEVSQKLNIPFVFGAIENWNGQVAVFNFKGSKSYKELFNFIDAPKKGGAVGVMGFLPGIVGSMQAAEAIKILTGKGEVLANKLLLISAKDNSYQVLNF